MSCRISAIVLKPNTAYCYCILNTEKLGCVVQLDRISDFGSEGWGFESLRGHIKQQAHHEIGGPFFLRMKLKYTYYPPTKTLVATPSDKKPSIRSTGWRVAGTWKSNQVCSATVNPVLFR